MDAGIQRQDGRPVSTKALIKPNMKSELPSMALDSGIHAGMTPMFLNLMAMARRVGTSGREAQAAA
jgi:hypothetical protein